MDFPLAAESTRPQLQPLADVDEEPHVVEDAPV